MYEIYSISKTIYPMHTVMLYKILPRFKKMKVYGISTYPANNNIYDALGNKHTSSIYYILNYIDKIVFFFRGNYLKFTETIIWLK